VIKNPKHGGSGLQIRNGWCTGVPAQLLPLTLDL